MQTLEQWLEVATQGLCDSAAARVRAEIGEHYLSALESANSAGVDQRDAERRALHALGEAKVANRQYRRVLLTESEARTLSRLTSRWPPVVGILLLAPFAIYATSPGPRSSTSYSRSASSKSRCEPSRFPRFARDGSCAFSDGGI